MNGAVARAGIHMGYYAGRTRRGAQLLSRWVTSSLRVLPNTLILGAMKSGTTSLHGMLVQHSQVHGGYKKEMHYFDSRSRLGVDPMRVGPSFYRAYFPYKLETSQEECILDASPSYLALPYVAERIQAVLPDAPMIVLLRNPTERAISHHFHEQQKGSIKMPIEEALRAEFELPFTRPDGSREIRSGNQPQYYLQHSYRYRGLYRHHLEKYFARFPREQLLILKSEDLFADPISVLRRVHEFIGIKAEVLPSEPKPLNVSEKSENIASAVYEELNAYFRPHNEALYEMLGEDFGWND